MGRPRRKPDWERLERASVAAARREYQATTPGRRVELIHPDLDGLIGGGRWVLKTRFGRLDIVQNVEPDIDYESLEAEAIQDVVFGARIRFCGYRHLIAMKQAAGRDQDLVDVARLRAVRGED